LAFLAQAVKANPKLKAGVAAYEKRAPLAGDDLVNISQGAWLYAIFAMTLYLLPPKLQ